MINLENCCYSFDRRMSLYDDVNYILDMYKASIITFQKTTGQLPNLYADTETIKYLNGYYHRCVDISDNSFSHVDDLKLYVHSVEDLSCVTIDGDILFSDTLRFPNEWNTQVYFEIEETEAGPLNPKYDLQNGYTSLRKIFQKNNVADFVKDYDYKNPSAYNVGILKFNCQRTKDLLLERYHDIRAFYESTIKYDDEIKDWFIPSIMLTQYYWGSVCKVNKINTTFLGNFNSYVHLYGALKYREGISEKIYEIIKNETQSKLL